MKNLILLFLLLSASTGWSQEIFNPMKNAIKAGDAVALAKQFNQQLDVTIDDNQASYTKAQAENVIGNFFRDNPPTEFAIMHTGASKGGLQFAIGKYTTKKTNYSVLMRVKDSGNVKLIHEISFVKE